jgi:osmotically-inducible protein OsmY
VQLQSAITQAIQASSLTANSPIVVHVNQGEVTLEGAAMSHLARREAARLAETVLGVTGVRNRLSVVNTQTAELPPEK